jgi:hypothetical protein
MQRHRMELKREGVNGCASEMSTVVIVQRNNISFAVSLVAINAVNILIASYHYR